MNINFYSYSDSKGGASHASYSIFKSLKNKYNKSFNCVNSKKKKSINHSNLFHRLYLNLLRVAEKILIFFFLKKKYHQSLNIFKSYSFKFDNQKATDINNIHWINRCSLSLKEIYNIKAKVVLSLHDMWFLDGTQHYFEKKNSNLNSIEKYCLNLKKKNFF